MVKNITKLIKLFLGKPPSQLLYTPLPQTRERRLNPAEIINLYQISTYIIIEIIIIIIIFKIRRKENEKR